MIYGDLYGSAVMLACLSKDFFTVKSIDPNTMLY
jgi:hypothetical protein